MEKERTVPLDVKVAGSHPCTGSSPSSSVTERQR